MFFKCFFFIFYFGQPDNFSPATRHPPPIKDDVVSEQIPPPAASASLRKSGAEYTQKALPMKV